MNRYANAGRQHDPTDFNTPFPQVLLLPDGRYACDVCDAAVDRTKLTVLGQWYSRHFVCAECGALHAATRV